MTWGNAEGTLLVGLARGFGFGLVVLALAAPLGAQDFPPITDLERALTRVEGAPNAPAVVLSRHADFYMMDLARNEISSRLVVRERVKILTEEGKSHGEREIHHNSYVRLYNLRAPAAEAFVDGGRFWLTRQRAGLDDMLATFVD